MTRVAAVDLGTNSTRLLVADVVGGRSGGDRTQADDHPARRRRRRAAPAPPRPDRARAELPRRVPTRARSRSARSERSHRDERRPRRRERRGVPRRDRVELRLQHAPAGRHGGGGDDDPRRDRGPAAARRRPRRGHRRRLDGARARDRTARSRSRRASTSAACGSRSGSSPRTRRPAPSSPARRHTCARCFPSSRRARAIGVAGTVTTLATLDLGDAEYDPARTHGHRVPLASVEAQLERLAAMTTEERLAVPGIEPGRAPVIVAGIVVLREVMTATGSTRSRCRERDVLARRGVRRRRASRAGGGRGSPGAYTCC